MIYVGQGKLQDRHERGAQQGLHDDPGAASKSACPVQKERKDMR